MRKYPCRVPDRFNEALQRFTNPGIIIDDSYDRFCHTAHRESSLCIHIPIVAGPSLAAYYVFILPAIMPLYKAPALVMKSQVFQLS